MFTGIIESLGKITDLKVDRGNIDFTIESDISQELKVDQSVSHNGVCLTIADISKETYLVNVVKETIDRSNLGLLNIGDFVNIERSMMMNDRIDGHIVQGHVDQIAECCKIDEQGGSYLMKFKYENAKDITVEKGSICINGISLTVCNSGKNTFTVAIIPYTWDNTNLKHINIGDTVNLEFDIVGKYISKILSKS